MRGNIMYNIQKDRFKPKRSKARLVPGEYRATVQSVRCPDGFEEGNAVEIVYSVQAKDGKQIEYPERYFIVEPYSERTLLFLEYIFEELELETIDDLVGMVFRLKLEFQVRNHHRFLNITDRSVLEGETDA